MNKYYGSMGADMGEGIQSLLMSDEQVIWAGYPKKSAYVLNASMKMMPFALIWLLFDGFFIFAIIGTGAMSEMGGMKWFLVGFFALHLMPVWRFSAPYRFS